VTLIAKSHIFSKGSKATPNPGWNKEHLTLFRAQLPQQRGGQNSESFDAATKIYGVIEINAARGAHQPRCDLQSLPRG
jgi:hypothetical protein